MVKKVKTTINIDEGLWKKFSHLIIDGRGYRKKNDVIEQLIKDYTEKNEEKKGKTPINKAIILAAGISSRLRPLTNKVPTCLLKINSKTILEHQISNLKKCGIKDINVIIGYKAEKIKNFCKKKSLKVNFIYNKNHSISGSLFSLWLARKNFKGGFICLNSDVIFDIEILKNLLKSKGNICLAVDKKECAGEDMKVKIKGDNVIQMGKRIPEEDVYGEFIGLIKFSENSIDNITNILNNLAVSFRKIASLGAGIQKLIDNGQEIQKMEIQKKYWGEIDFVEDFNETKTQLIKENLF